MEMRKFVALRKESVDRNTCWMSIMPSRARVALRKESVDRNGHRTSCRCRVRPKSLSARRAWIEIFRGWTLNINGPMSLSARRAWIEITTRPATPPTS